MTRIERAPAPAVEHRAPLCSICGKETACEDGWYCEDCGAHWDYDGGFACWSDDDDRQCASTAEVTFVGLPERTVRCLKPEEHIDSSDPEVREHTSGLHGWDWGGQHQSDRVRETAPALTVEQREARDEAEAEATKAAVEAWNAEHAVGDLVRYWPFKREGDGRVAKLRLAARDYYGEPVVWVDGWGMPVPLGLVEAVPESTGAPA